MGLFGKKQMLQCTCGCGCRESFEKYGRRTMDIYAEQSIGYEKKWKGDYTICIDCNLDQHSHSTKEDSQTIRKGWTEIQKEQVRIRQDGKCNVCKRPPPHWEYHHKDGNRSNNSLDNCEGLCPNCHSVKTHG